MSIFNTILEKIGLEKPAAPAPSSPAAAPSKSAAPSGPSATPYSPISSSGPSATPYSPISSSGPIAVPLVDVVSKLDSLQASFHNPQLTWRVSISDLLYILKIDNSSKGLNDLAVELGCPEALMSDSAKRNMWLHSTVLKKIAENGGNIPPELLKK